MRARSRLAAGGASLLMLTALFGVIGATSAEARCAGQGNGVTSTMSYGGTVRVRDVPNSGTCNGDGEYHATLVDASSSDGHRVSFRWDGNGDGNYTSGGSVENGSVGILVTDNTSRAHEQLCMITNAGNVYCGWGSDVGTGYGSGGFGVNSGF
ncbi:hypothetical protein [Promicromonospora sp. NPDC059942]|uniref:hypothetical protein n=1 Tax=Promicromonospora sp. NPDC059942 TaxID=3347009 RepID=UPI003651F499